MSRWCCLSASQTFFALLEVFWFCDDDVDDEVKEAEEEMMADLAISMDVRGVVAVESDIVVERVMDGLGLVWFGLVRWVGYEFVVCFL